ncbi:MAG: glycosyltransferase [Clostridium sp.]|uniref:glycosyltransferase n=1 Tax=Clostridium sp. TaxID=1506 RepID=UPI0025C6BF4A|nr:glycosyltransferase [Clostridium sp.]MCE5222112.1 glycosyltransferase [Clostridium sp.]
MKKFFSTLLVLMLFTTLLLPFKVYGIDNEIPLSNSIVNMKIDQRKLWIDHVSWTRSFIISDLASLADKDPVLERLLKNQDDIGASIKPYYGEEAGNKLSKLLREHIVIAGQVVDSAKSNNKSDLDKYNKSWYKNADDIADFLSSANSNWVNSELKDMLHKHLEFVTAQVVARLNKNWKADIEAYDKGEEHMIKFADVLSDGIVKQFPQKFS